MRKYKIWGGDRTEKDALYIWAQDMDEAFKIARKEDPTVTAAQWTGEESNHDPECEFVDLCRELHPDINCAGESECLSPWNEYCEGADLWK